LNGKDAVLVQHTDDHPADGFRPGSRAGVFTRTVAASDIEEFAKVVVSVDVDGVGPFTVTSVRSPEVDVTYRGGERDRAAALEGLAVGDAYEDGGDVFGTVDVGRVSNVREDVTPIDLSA
jgi:hypothetical protein